MSNIDETVVREFGAEWVRFDQSALPEDDFNELFSSYFGIFPWGDLPSNAVGADIGCGSGRWARGVAARVGTLHCVDASIDALASAKKNLAAFTNCQIHCAEIAALPLGDESLDFAYSLGVLHHMPLPEKGLREVVRKLRPGAPILLYLYYRFDNKPAWFRIVWSISDLIRRGVSRTPSKVKHALAEVFAAGVYWPLARVSGQLERIGVKVDNVPLSIYRNRSFYVMRTDALDRFGTRLEHRFTREEIAAMMMRCGLQEVRFSNSPPYWIACGTKR